MYRDDTLRVRDNKGVHQHVKYIYRRIRTYRQK